MTLLQALVLGFVQGMTEFLPVSSSGHLVITEYFLGISNVIVYDTFLHLATLLAVVIFFRTTILSLKLREWVLVGVGTIPAVLVGFFLKDSIESAFNSLLFVTGSLFVTGLLLIITHRVAPSKHPEKSSVVSINLRQSILIGIAQAVAIFPGISRSGSTTTVGILSGVSREDAFKFSFLLALPAILGAGILQLKDVYQAGNVFEQPWNIYISGACVAFLFGLLSLQWFRYVIKKAKLHYFGYYCWAVSGFLAIWQLITLLV